MDINALNRAAREKRATYPASGQLDITQLAALPPLYDWVHCSSGHSGFRMMLAADDDGIALRFFWNGSYEKTTLKAWAHYAKKVGFAIDIGAHTGAYTLAAMVFSKAKTPQAKDRRGVKSTADICRGDILSTQVKCKIKSHKIGTF